MEMVKVPWLNTYVPKVDLDAAKAKLIGMIRDTIPLGRDHRKEPAALCDMPAVPNLPSSRFYSILSSSPAIRSIRPPHPAPQALDPQGYRGDQNQQQDVGEGLHGSLDPRRLEGGTPGIQQREAKAIKLQVVVSDRSYVFVRNVRAFL